MASYAAGTFTLCAGPASRWLLHLDFRLRVKGNGRFSATNLKVKISGPGQ